MPSENPREVTPAQSELITKIVSLLEEAGCPQRINESICRYIEFWERGEVQKDYDTNHKAGLLLIGFSDRLREVVVDLGEDRTGHMCFTPEQARAYAALMITKASECEEYWSNK